MAWNPSKEVTVAREAAKSLGDAAVCVVIWVTADGERLGMASYGKTKKICEGDAKALGDHLYRESMKFAECNGIDVISGGMESV